MTSPATTTGKTRALIGAKLALVAAAFAIASTASAQAYDRGSVYAEYTCIELAEERDAILSRFSSASPRVIRALREIRFFEERSRCAKRVRNIYDDAPYRYRGYRKSPPGV